MSLGTLDSVPAPFVHFLFPLGKSPRSFVTQFPCRQTRIAFFDLTGSGFEKWLSTQWDGTTEMHGFGTHRRNWCISFQSNEFQVKSLPLENPNSMELNCWVENKQFGCVIYEKLSKDFA